MQINQQLIEQTIIMQALYALMQEGSTQAERELRTMIRDITDDSRDEGISPEQMREIVRAANSRISDVAQA